MKQQLHQTATFFGKAIMTNLGIINGVVHIFFDFYTILVTLHGGCSWTRTQAIQITIQIFENFNLQTTLFITTNKTLHRREITSNMHAKVILMGYSTI